MTADVIAEAIPVAQPLRSRFESAADLLQEAANAGCTDPAVLRMLADACRRQGKPAEARDALRRIGQPDAGVYLQMGLLSVEEGQLGQAEGEFVRAWQIAPESFEAGYNLLLIRLAQGQIEACAAMAPRLLELTDDPNSQRCLGNLLALLRSTRGSNGDHTLDPVLLQMSAEEEEELLQLLRGLGQLDVVYELVKTLTAARPNSPHVQEAHVEVVLVKAKSLLDRTQWAEAEQLLLPLARERRGERMTQAAVFNLLGCCACLGQDFEAGTRAFATAIKLADSDARLHQNLALVYEWVGELAKGDPHWNRYFDLLDRRLPAPIGLRDYVERLAYESLGRLATVYAEKERWSSALVYLERARKYRPNDPDTLERLFHLYNHAHCPQDARRILQQLREIRPGDPQLDLFELDLADVKNATDIERVVGSVEALLKKHAGDTRVEDRAVALIGNALPMMSNLTSQLTAQLNKVVHQVRELPSYQINWPAVDGVMRDLLKEYQKLRRIAGKCLPLVKSEDQRRGIRDLADHIDRKMDVCRSMRE